MSVSPERTRGLGRRFMLKLTPYLTLLYFFLFLDRQNINFAGLQMSERLTLTATSFGLAIGLFSIGYLFFELPSTLLLRHFGARTWLARIMVTWGLVSASTAFVTTPQGLYAIRFLLGAAEAGFVPGVLFYLTNWLPAAERTRVVGIFMIAVPVSTILGAPVSGFLLGIHWLGLQGWQWLFLLEGIPAALLGVSILRFLPDKPADASWLSPTEKVWVRESLEHEQAQVLRAGRGTIRSAMTAPIVWLLGLIYLGNNVGLFGISAWLPTLTHDTGLSYKQTGFAISLVYLVMAVAMIVWSRHASQTEEYIWHVVAPSLIGVVCVVTAGLLRKPTVVVIMLSAALILMSPVTPTFWSLPSKYLSGAGAAAGIPLISSIGALGAFIGPAMLGFMKDHSGNFAAAYVVLAVGPFFAAILTISLRGHRAFSRTLPS